MNIASTKKNEVVRGLLVRNISSTYSSYKSCIIEYLHKQQYLIGLDRTFTKYNALFKVYLMYVLQYPSDWGANYTLMRVGYAHTI